MNFVYLSPILVLLVLQALCSLPLLVSTQTSGLLYQDKGDFGVGDTNIKLPSNIKSALDNKRNETKNPFDLFFRVVSNPELIKIRGTGKVSKDNLDQFQLDHVDISINEDNNSHLVEKNTFDWALKSSETIDKSSLSSSFSKDTLSILSEKECSKISDSFLRFLKSWKSTNEELSHKEWKASYMNKFKEIALPNIINPVYNSELEGASRGIIQSELLAHSKPSNAVIAKNRPDGLPAMTFLAIGYDYMALQVKFDEVKDGFIFTSYPNYSPDIPEIAHLRLRAWVTSHYKKVYDSLTINSSNLETSRMIENIRNYGIFFVIEFRDDATCYLIKVTYNGTNEQDVNSGNNTYRYFTRVSRLLFARLKPFIPFRSSFVPTTVTEFRSLSFIGSPFLLKESASLEDQVTQQTLFFWSVAAEEYYPDYRRADHVCHEVDLFQSSEHSNLCILPPGAKDPKVPSQFSSPYRTTVSCFGLYPVDTVAIFKSFNLVRVKICQVDGKWSNSKILEDQVKAVVYLQRCQSRISHMFTLYDQVKTKKLFEKI
ncbi:uncharacterized protein CMU_034290 [Cryptosporidium muris RN66]|uniref:Uncharacterized protein n=1 Tax=Cryptosporidium muris (strain RN66) TaxID=441375 RepID=B6AFQ2_CRYMR|nr:uncharacterized protein CMU_034290 [Cryptosporidium muris RN66]EEA07043.1 hypothetical protein, conserved [Cryptosporidium muris RN66]|eukprot:XP_002141392.1 hypothetical protein [Cryptosporidium muris RN66]